MAACAPLLYRLVGRRDEDGDLHDRPNNSKIHPPYPAIGGSPLSSLEPLNASREPSLMGLG